MASLREFEEKPGAPRAGDGRGQPPVREHHIEPGEAEAPEPRVRVVRLEAVSLAEGVEEIGQGHGGGYELHPVGEDRDGIVDAGQHYHEVHRRPRRGLRARAEEHHEAAHEDADHQRGEEAPEEEEGEGPGSSPDEIEAEGPGADEGHEGEDHHPARHPDQPRAHRHVPDADRGEELVLHGLGPDVEEHGIGDVELAHLHGGQRHRAHEDEGGHARVQVEEAREEPVREHGHPGPEGELEDEEDVPPRHDDVAVGEGPRPHQLDHPWLGGKRLGGEGIPRELLARERVSEQIQRTPPRARAPAPGSPSRGRPARAASAGSRPGASPRSPPCTRCDRP